MVSGLQGFFDGVLKGVAHGWLYDENATGVALAVVIDENEQFRIVANGHRPDLAEAGFGDCLYMFDIPEVFRDGAVHQLQLRHIDRNVFVFDEPVDFMVLPSIDSGDQPMNAAALLVATTATALSVVLPTFNRADMLEETLENLMTTIGTDPIEMVVVDDGSTDRTADLLAAMTIKYPKLKFASISNGGPGNARNVGAAMATGELIMFVGDDTRATSPDLFRSHIATHRKYPERSLAVLGKIIWPDRREVAPNFVMQLIQGDGQQQFGYKFMQPWKKYEYWAFYTANVSVKADIVKDWMKEGFSPDYTLAAFEDADFAYRMSKNYPDFGIFYNPNAVVEHHHPYDVAGFMRRQVNAGLMMDVMVRRHPELAEQLLGSRLAGILSKPGASGVTNLPMSHYSAVVEGLRSWAVVLDAHYGLGSQNWHADFLNAIFKLSLYDGYLSVQRCPPSARAEAYKYLLEDFRTQFGRSIAHEAMGGVGGFSLI